MAKGYRRGEHAHEVIADTRIENIDGANLNARSLKDRASVVVMESPPPVAEAEANKRRGARTSRSRKSNRSTYVEPQSIFGSAMESLFGKNSIFSALDGPPSDESSLEHSVDCGSPLGLPSWTRKE